MTTRHVGQMGCLSKSWYHNAIGGQICTPYVYCLQNLWAPYLSQPELALVIYFIAKSASTSY